MRLILVCLLFSSQIFAQQYLSKNGDVSFFSEAPIENIEAVNKKATGVIDLRTGGFAFQIMIEDFVFPNSLMQEHFNESYMESDKFPNSTFTGVISDISTLDLSKEQSIDVSGNFLLHGINRQMNMTATISLKDEKLNISSQFDIVLDDFNIDIPKIMMYKIAEVINVTIEMNLQKLSNE
jgi:hypothetical protein